MFNERGSKCWNVVNLDKYDFFFKSQLTWQKINYMCKQIIKPSNEKVDDVHKTLTCALVIEVPCVFVAVHSYIPPCLPTCALRIVRTFETISISPGIATNCWLFLYHEKVGLGFPSASHRSVTWLSSSTTRSRNGYKKYGFAEIG